MSCGTSPIADLAADADGVISRPSTWTVPAVGVRSPQIIEMVVVLPAPFGPSRP